MAHLALWVEFCMLPVRVDWAKSMFRTWVWIGWVVAGALAVALYSERSANRFAFHPIDSHDKTEQGEQKNAISGQRGAPLQNKPPAREYKPDCTKSDKAELCAQRRAAQAAEDQAQYTLLGIVFVIVTLIASIKAAVGATDAAKVAHAAFVTDQRPWLVIGVLSVGPVTVQGNTVTVWVDLLAINKGKTPARNVQIHVDVRGQIDVEGRRTHEKFAEFVAIGSAPAPSIMRALVLPTGSYRSSTPEIIDDIRRDVRTMGDDVRKFYLSAVYCVTYQAMFSDEVYHTGNGMSLWPERSGMFQFVDGTVPAEVIARNDFLPGMASAS